MPFLVNENVTRTVIQELRQRGHSVVTDDRIRMRPMPSLPPHPEDP
jgi:hypothetical protein